MVNEVSSIKAMIDIPALKNERNETQTELDNLMIVKNVQQKIIDEKELMQITIKTLHTYNLTHLSTDQEMIAHSNAITQYLNAHIANADELLRTTNAQIITLTTKLKDIKHKLEVARKK